MAGDSQEAIIKVQIFTMIPELLLIKVQKLKTAKKVWDAYVPNMRRRH